MDPYHYKNKKILSPLDKNPIEEKVVSSTIESDSGEEETNKSTEETKKGAGEDNPSILDHLTELRKQLIKSIIVFLLVFVAVFSTINIWFPYITKGNKLIVLSPMEVISFYTSISAMLAFGLTVPLLCHFLWQFVKPGLNENENRFFSLYSPVILLLFLSGIAFGYYIVNPLSYQFLVGLGSIHFEVMISAQEYARFLLLTTMPIGLLFELPVAALFLSNIGLITSVSMKKFRKWSYIVLAVLSGLITPPDFFSQLIILIPMIGLYEASIFIVTRNERRIVSETEGTSAI
ncbi:MAG TPA: twin-arginine translocase subunit TatC [Pseudogracilibacillus sp.]|nr:twin-arginine translocase subunit TatC [Pseudogracilibacillus sp.]